MGATAPLLLVFHGWNDVAQGQRVDLDGAAYEATRIVRQSKHGELDRVRVLLQPIDPPPAAGRSGPAASRTPARLLSGPKPRGARAAKSGSPGRGGSKR